MLGEGGWDVIPLPRRKIFIHLLGRRDSSEQTHVRILDVMSPKLLSTTLIFIPSASGLLCLSPSLERDVATSGIEKEGWSSCHSFEGSLKFRSWVDVVDMMSTSKCSLDQCALSPSEYVASVRVESLRTTSYIAVGQKADHRAEASRRR